MEFRNFKGRANRLDDIDLPRIGHKINVGEDELRAFLEVESQGEGFDEQGRPKMLFEPHVFYRNLKGQKLAVAIKAGLAYRKWGEQRYPKDSYPRLLKALEIDETAALKSASWGLTQVLGESHELAGYETVQDMVRAFMADEEFHVEAMVEFLINTGIDDDLRAHRWDVVARVYNGPSYAKHNYHGKMKAAYAKWAKKPDAPWSPDGEKSTFKHSETKVRRVQERLDALGYPEVGAIDGMWGSKTRAAVLAFRADNDLPLVAEIDEELMAHLMMADRRQVSPIRATATLADLRADGAEDVKAADKTQFMGYAAAGSGALAAVNEVADQVEQYSDTASRFLSVLDPIKGFMVDNLWIILLGIGGYVVWQSGVLKRIRLDKHRSGEDVSA